MIYQNSFKRPAVADPDLARAFLAIEDEFRKLAAVLASAIPSVPPAGSKKAMNLYVDGDENLVYEYEE